MAKLEDFEGKPVAQVGVELPAAAGGLREALRVDPQVWLQGDKVYLVFEATTLKVRHEPIDKADPKGPQRRVHLLRVDGATSVDGDLVATPLEQQRVRIEQAKGIQRLPYEEGELGLAHARGEHADSLAEGCPVCDLERDTKLAEEAAAAEPPAVAPIKGRRQRRVPAAK